MSLRYYANAPATTLAAACSSSATIITVESTAGLPIQYPYTLILDRGESTEEAVSVTNASGTTLTVTRAIDGTTAFAHAFGATVEHGITAQDVREPNTHVNSNGNVHGVTSDVVGTDDVQTLTNKNLSDATNVFPASLATDAEVAAVQTAADNAQASADTASSNLSIHQLDTTTHGATGAVVGTTNTQTLTNKDLSSGTNTFPSTLATTASVTALEDRIQTGVASVTANDTSRHTVAVVFPTPFSTTPKVFTNPQVSGPDITFTSAFNVTTTGFTLAYVRTLFTPTTFDVDWLAVS